MFGNIKIVAAIGITLLLVLSANIGLVSPVKSDAGFISEKQLEMENVWLTVGGNQTGVKAVDKWGEIETFGNTSTGTLGNFDNVSLAQSPGIESVILDHHVWIMMRSNATDAPVLNYTPEIKGSSWNITLEGYAPKGNDNLSANGSYPQGFGLKAFVIDKARDKLAGVELSYGSPGYSFIRIFDAKMGSWENVSDEILPSTTHKSPQCGMEPDRYIISFCSSDARTCNITVLQTAVGVIGSRVVTMPGLATPYQLVMQGNATTLSKKVLSSKETLCGGWIVSRIGIRGGTARYPFIEPNYEYVVASESVPTNVTGAVVSQITDATVMIAGVKASYIATKERYEASLSGVVDWSVPVNYDVTVDGVTTHGMILVTYVSPAPHASVSQWWNGWDWVSVFGLDDCSSPGMALSKYSGYHHPVTAYLLATNGNAADILPTQSEIGLHYPHLWWRTNSLFWSEARTTAQQGQKLLDNYPFASRWDDPANGGNGRTFISMANPGNWASYQLLYAEYQDGIRIDGNSGNNASQIGSWFLPNQYVSPGSGWDPYTPMDLMDASRQLSTDVAYSWNDTFRIVDQIAQNHGLLRVYGHPETPIKISSILHWIDDNKTDYSYENWKATDGEVASYVYGRWSTDVTFDTNLSNDRTWTYEVKSKDPKMAGYWSVPITIALETKGRPIKDIEIIDRSNTYKMSDGSLKNLHGKRVMDTGYDIRNGKLYISQLWNSNATLRITFADPGTPSCLSAIPGNGQVILAWTVPLDNGNIIINYDLYRSTIFDGTYTLIASPTGLSYTDSGLTNGQTYWYEVSAKEATREGAVTAPVSSMPFTVPNAPTDLIVVSGSAQVSLNWTAPAFNGGRAVDYYVIYQDDIALPDHRTNLTTVISDLSNGQNYSFKVAAHNSAGNGIQSHSVSATPNNVPNPPSLGLAVADLSQIILTWSPNGNGSSPIIYYKLYRSDSENGTYILISSLLGLNYVDTNLTSGQTYWYKVSAVNAAGEGAPCKAISALVPQPFAIWTLILAVIAIGVVLIAGLFVVHKRKGKK